MHFYSNSEYEVTCLRIAITQIEQLFCALTVEFDDDDVSVVITETALNSVDFYYNVPNGVSVNIHTSMNNIDETGFLSCDVLFGTNGKFDGDGLIHSEHWFHTMKPTELAHMVGCIVDTISEWM